MEGLPNKKFQVEKNEQDFIIQEEPTGEVEESASEDESLEDSAEGSENVETV